MMISIPRRSVLQTRYLTLSRPSPISSRQFHRSFSPLLSSSSSSSSSESESPPIFQAIDSDVYPFGVPSNDRTKALFLSLNWTIPSTSTSQDQAWAILSSSSSSSSTTTSSTTTTTSTTSRSNLISTILGNQVRYEPIGSVKHPFIETLPPVQQLINNNQGGEGGELVVVERDRTVNDLIGFVSFKTRLGGGGGGSNSGFQDHTARYYSIREEDKLTLRQYLTQQQSTDSVTTTAELESTAELLNLKDFLDLPLITLSNGQTRRSRILISLLKKPKPELLILEEPFTGLDSKSRIDLERLLNRLHENQNPRILLVLRVQDELPKFINHLALVVEENPPPQGGGPGTVKFGTREEILRDDRVRDLIRKGEQERFALKERKKARQLQLQQQQHDKKKEEEEEGEVLVKLENVNVEYGRDRKRSVLKNVDWTIRSGEKWVLSGHNGSGKSTLLSIILGDHPKSFTEKVTIFEKPRFQLATSTIQQSIGHVSPEIFNSFPRKHDREQGLTVFDTLVTGFESIYSFRKPTLEQQEQISSILSEFSDIPSLSSTRTRQEFLNKLFATLTPGEQSLVLLLRALVKRPKLLILDEPFQGMDFETINIVKRWLNKRREQQSIVLISHFEEEIPISFDRRLELENGSVKELI
ncbi:hypothetical protein JCM3765_007875 [Sporobolomyces pararoseus]